MLHAHVHAHVHVHVHVHVVWRAGTWVFQISVPDVVSSRPPPRTPRMLEATADRTPAAKHTSSRSSVQQKRPATRPAPRVRSLRRLLASATRSVYIQRFNNASSIQPCRDERTRVESVGSPSRAKPPPGMKGRCRLGAIVSSGTSLSVIPYLRHGKRDRPAHARVSSRHTCKCECANKALLEGTRTRTR
jgi:hypothetical protein